MKNLIWVFVIILGLLVPSVFAQNLTGLKPGTMAPDFSLPNDVGQTYKLSQYRNKKPVLVEFFLTQCPHCQRSSHWIQYLYQHEHTPFQILAINADSLKGQKNTTAAFRKTFKVTYPILQNPAADLLRSYQFSTFPYLGVVNMNGQVVWSHQGELMPNDVVAIEKALRQSAKH